ASSAAVPGTYTVTITGKSGGLSHPVPITLVIDSTISTASVTTTQGGPWINTAFPSHTGTFTVTFDADPSDYNVNAEVGLSSGAQTADSGFPVLLRFDPSGYIDAINGSSFTQSNITYLWAMGAVTNHFRVVVNLSTHTYSAYVSVPYSNDSAEKTIGTNLKFNSSQSSVTKLTSWGAVSAVGTETVSNFGY
ncbi:MAG: hypothetical protein ABSE59_07100, partial [Opitutaceae bacterium]